MYTGNFANAKLYNFYTANLMKAIYQLYTWQA